MHSVVMFLNWQMVFRDNLMVIERIAICYSRAIFFQFFELNQIVKSTAILDLKFTFAIS